MRGLTSGDPHSITRLESVVSEMERHFPPDDMDLLETYVVYLERQHDSRLGTRILHDPRPVLRRVETQVGRSSDLALRARMCVVVDDLVCQPDGTSEEQRLAALFDAVEAAAVTAGTPRADVSATLVEELARRLIAADRVGALDVSLSLMDPAIGPQWTYLQLWLELLPWVGLQPALENR